MKLKKCKKGHAYDRIDSKGYNYCSTCSAIAHKRWKNNNPEAMKVFKSRSRYYMVQHRYGLSVEQYKKLVKLSKNKCNICKVFFSKAYIKTRCHIDHDHKTGKVRGLLCHLCNNGLGNFLDTIKIMKKAIIYLEKHNGKN